MHRSRYNHCFYIEIVGHYISFEATVCMISWLWQLHTSKYIIIISVETCNELKFWNVESFKHCYMYINFRSALNKNVSSYNTCKKKYLVLLTVSLKSQCIGRGTIGGIHHTAPTESPPVPSSQQNTRGAYFLSAYWKVDILSVNRLIT